MDSHGGSLSNNATLALGVPSGQLCVLLSTPNCAGKGGIDRRHQPAHGAREVNSVPRRMNQEFILRARVVLQQFVPQLLRYRRGAAHSFGVESRV